MLDIWNSAGSQGTQQQLLELGTVAPPFGSNRSLRSLQEPYTRTAANEIRNLFPRLPNPDLVMYVYPHLAIEQHRSRVTQPSFLFTNACSTPHCRVNVSKIVVAVPDDSKNSYLSTWKAWRNPLRPRATLAMKPHSMRTTRVHRSPPWSNTSTTTRFSTG